MDNRRVQVSWSTVLMLTTPLVLFSTHALAGGFQIFEQNAASIGSYHAGGAAIAEDASTAFFNPAGLTRLQHPQVTLSGTNIFTHGAFKGTATTTANNTLNPITGSEFNQTSTRGSAVVPALQIAYPIDKRTVFALDFSVPFGLATDWDEDSVVRYAATKSSIETLNISPNIAYAFNQQWSVGAGVDIQQLKGTFDLIASMPSIGSNDTNATNEVDGFGYGWHLGVLYQLDPTTRFGLNYRSQIRHDAKGDSKFRGPLSETNTDMGIANDHHVSVQVTLPATTTLSAFHQLNDHLDLMASVYYTQWSVIDKLQLNGVTSLGVANTTVTNPTHYHDTFSYDIGLNYRPNGKWQISFGAGYDQTPVRNTYRDIRLPDGNRIALSSGVRYSLSKQFYIDADYAHLFIKSGHIDHTDKFECDLSGMDVSGPCRVDAKLQGKTRGSADLLGLQFTYTM